MARPNKNHEPKKEALVQTAFDLFVEQGYENVTVAQIMREAGLTKAGMYHYFTSKEEILDAAIDHGIAQDIQKLRDEMQGLPLLDRLILFIHGNTIHDDLAGKLLYYKGSNKDSYAAYRIREKSIHADIPLLEEIIMDGLAQGVYKVDYPHETAEYLVLMAKAAVEANLLPQAGTKGKKLRLQAFLQLVGAWLRPEPEHMAAVEKAMMEEFET